QRFDDRFLPGTDAVGRRIRLGGLESDEAWVEIVGVVPNHRVEGVGNVEPGEETDQPGIYLPLAQQDARFLSIAARAEGVAPLSLAGAVREAVAAVDADTPLYYERTLREAMDQNLWFYRVFGTLFLVFGLAALFLASVGLYGVMSFSVTQRTGEMGIRMALGAQGGQVLRMILRQGLRQILIGVAVGSLLAIVVARGLAFLLYQVEPWDPGTFTAVLVLLALTGMGASLVPALRATRVDPGVALRND
ncbi:MAG TPA: FtsX-like permease family protein, partial [Longimicrobiales bacterium]|nr:FtsX-like permease family protein [Longimicrobiales bacterium]